MRQQHLDRRSPLQSGPERAFRREHERERESAHGELLPRSQPGGPALPRARDEHDDGDHEREFEQLCKALAEARHEQRNAYGSEREAAPNTSAK
ncbi:MAG: hypothetical protein U1E73_11875 [Planctomycetota bacterium]